MKSCVLFPLAPGWWLEQAVRFPRRMRLGSNRIGWFYHELPEWITARKLERESRSDVLSACPPPEEKR